MLPCIISINWVRLAEWPSVRQGVAMLIRWWRRQWPGLAERRFKELRDPLAYILQQAVQDGEVKEPARSDVVAWLERLDIWPMGIMGWKSEKMVGAEADYLRRCTEYDGGLEWARLKFPKVGQQEWKYPPDGAAEFLADQLGRFFDQMATLLKVLERGAASSKSNATNWG